MGQYTRGPYTREEHILFALGEPVYVPLTQSATKGVEFATGRSIFTFVNGKTRRYGGGGYRAYGGNGNMLYEYALPLASVRLLREAAQNALTRWKRSPERDRLLALLEQLPDPDAEPEP